MIPLVIAVDGYLGAPINIATNGYIQYHGEIVNSLMMENQINSILFPLIGSFLADEFGNVSCYQSYQPNQQGVNSGAGVYINRIGQTHRYGSPQSKSYWDGFMEIQSETQILETTYQCDALLIENPALETANTVTSCDIVEDVAGYLQSAEGLAALKAANLSVYRITDIRLTYMMDDMGRYESSPSFDFTLQYESVKLSEAPIVSTFEAGLYPI